MSISLVSFNPSGIMGTLTVSLQQSDDSFLNVRCQVNLSVNHVERNMYSKDSTQPLGLVDVHTAVQFL